MRVAVPRPKANDGATPQASLVTWSRPGTSPCCFITFSRNAVPSPKPGKVLFRSAVRRPQVAVLTPSAPVAKSSRNGTLLTMLM